MSADKDPVVTDFAFAVVPFGAVHHPSYPASLLKASLAQRGFSSTVLYPCMRLAERIGYELYRKISSNVRSLVGEWFFADLVFDGLPPVEEYTGAILSRYKGLAEAIPAIVAARAAREDFLDTCLREIMARRPRVVGFPTMFSQTCAALAVAKRLKALPDPPVVVFGGANCEGEMGLQMLRSFPWIDHVFIGESDRVLPAFLDGLLRTGDPRPLSGVLGRGEAERLTTPEPERELDALPIPDYSDYFARLRGSPIERDFTPFFWIEASRGCWWGEKQHCTFCGLNPETMAYRSKSPERVFDEITTLSSTFGVRRFDSIDNILDLKYLETLFPRLAEAGLELNLFFETKSNLKLHQIRLLRAAGMREIQPGIESLSDPVLRLMRKGCTALQNIQLLRWCREADLGVMWNLLFGFPGEPPEEYARTAALLPLLAHLEPPRASGPIKLDRFSPYFREPERYGILAPRPVRAYRYVFPLPPEDLARLVYYFENDYPDGIGEYTAATRSGVKAWLDLWAEPEERRPRLDLVHEGGALVITDTRPCAVAPRHRLEGLAAQLYLRCDASLSVAALPARLGATEAEIRRVLEDLVAARLLIEMGSHSLSLAVFRDRPHEPGTSRQRRALPVVERA